MVVRRWEGMGTRWSRMILGGLDLMAWMSMGLRGVEYECENENRRAWEGGEEVEMRGRLRERSLGVMALGGIASVMSVL